MGASADVGRRTGVRPRQSRPRLGQRWDDCPKPTSTHAKLTEPHDTQDLSHIPFQLRPQPRPKPINKPISERSWLRPSLSLSLRPADRTALAVFTSRQSARPLACLPADSGDRLIADRPPRFLGTSSARERGWKPASRSRPSAGFTRSTASHLRLLGSARQLRQDETGSSRDRPPRIDQRHEQQHPVSISVVSKSTITHLPDDRRGWVKGRDPHLASICDPDHSDEVRQETHIYRHGSEVAISSAVPA